MYDYLVREKGRVYAVSLDESGSLILDVESEERLRGAPFKDDGTIAEVGKVKFATIGLYQTLETPNFKASGKVLWFPHFTGNQLLVYDYPNGRLYSVDVGTGKAELLLEDIASFMPFTSKTCCGVTEYRFVVSQKGKGYLYSFDAYSKLRKIKSVGAPFTHCTDEVAYYCKDKSCKFVGYDGTVVRINGIFRENIMEARVVQERESVVVLTRDSERSAVVSVSDYQIMVIIDGMNAFDVPYVTFDGEEDFSLSDASPEHVLLHTASNGFNEFRVYSLDDIINEVEETEPLINFGETVLPDEGVLKDGKVYALAKGEPVVISI